MVDAVVPGAPGSWVLTTLGELCDRGGGSVQTGPFGSQLHAADYVEDGIPTVMPVNIGDNRIIETGIARVREEDANRLARHRLRSGDIIYSRRGDVERRALVREAETGWLCGTGCLRVRPGGDVDGEWLSYYLGHPAVREWIVRHAIGATMPNLNTGVLSALPVVVPSWRQQRAIAEVLAALDDKIDANASIEKTCWALASAHHERATASAVGPVPLGDMVGLAYGKALPAATRMSGDVPVFGSGGLVGWHDKALVRGPGVIVGRKGTAGSVHWSHGPFFPIDTTFFVRPRDDVPMLYAYFVMKSLRLERMNFDSAVPGLNRAAALQRRVPMPSPTALGVFASVATPVIERAEAARNESNVLERLRDTLLPPLLSGELRVRDAEAVLADAT